MKKTKILLGVVISGIMGVSLNASAATIMVNTPPGFSGAYGTPQNMIVTPGGGVPVDQFNQSNEAPPIPESATNIQAREQQENLQAQAQANKQAGITTQPEEEIGNAFSQGYGESQKNNEQELSDFMQYNSARQKGIKVTVPSYKFDWAKSRSEKVWFTNWKGQLVERAGISPEKVDFEAGRLSKDDFNQWASRMVRATGQ